MKKSKLLFPSLLLASSLGAIAPITVSCGKQTQETPLTSFE